MSRRDRPIDPIRVRVLRLPHAADLPLPSAASTGSAGLDLLAALPSTVPSKEPADGAPELGAGERALVPTGLVLELPEGTEAQVRPRSGLALRHGVTVLNAPGTVDSDYRGEIGVLLVNLGDEPFTVERGDRIAQLVVARVRAVEWVPVDGEADDLASTDRGAGGFGSTGR